MKIKCVSYVLVMIGKMRLELMQQERLTIKSDESTNYEELRTDHDHTGGYRYIS